MTHAASASKDGFDRRVQRLNDAEANGVIAVRGNTVEVIHQRVAEFLHLRQTLPPQRLQPPEEESGHALLGIIRSAIVAGTFGRYDHGLRPPRHL